MRKCTHCSSDVEEDASFCTSCGKELPKQKECIKCDKYIDEDCDWCVYCGAKQSIEVETVKEENPIQQKKCIQCDKMIEKDCDWCNNCGAKQTGETSLPKTEIPIPPKKSKKTSLIISILLIICLVSGGIFFFGRDYFAQWNKERLMEESKRRDFISAAQVADSIHMADSIAALEYIATQSKETENDGVICPEPRCGGIEVTSISVVASHTLPNQGSNSYQASNLLDGNSSTIWATHFTGNEETLTFYMNVNKLYKLLIVNGYRKDGKSFKNNSLAKSIKVYVDNVLAAKEELLDYEYERELESVPAFPDWIMLDKEYNNVREVKIVIESVYQGSKWNDLCISDIIFFTKE